MELVAGQGEHVHGDLGQVDGDLAHGLDRVRVKEDAFFLGDGGQLLDGVEVAGLVVGPHDGDDGRVLPDGVPQVVRVQAAAFVNLEVGDLVAVLFRQVLAETEDRRMLHVGGDDVAFFGLGVQGGADGRVVRLGPAGGENDFGRVAIEQSGHLFPGALEVHAHLPAEAVHGGGVAVELGEVGLDGLENGRVHLGGGVVVHVDGIHGLILRARSGRGLLFP